jgi:hypothetical protein
LLVVMGFIFGGPERTVIGPYRLERFESGDYYLHKRGRDDSAIGGSIIEGIVQDIGWNGRFLVAKRHSFYAGDPDGWMIIDIASGEITGPFNEAEFKNRAECQGIQVYGAADAFKRLRR